MITDTEQQHLAISEELEEDAVPEINCKCPNSGELPGEFVRPKEWMERLQLEQFATLSDAPPYAFRKRAVVALEFRSIANGERHRRDAHRSRSLHDRSFFAFPFRYEARAAATSFAVVTSSYA